jgi:hypothetical protein
VCSTTEVLNFKASKRSGSNTRAVVENARVRDKRDVNILIRARLEKTNLTTSDAFFAWCTKDGDFAR